MTSSAKELHLGTLEDYDGKEATFQAWIRSVKLYLLINEKIYDTDQKKITTTFTSDTINNKKFGTSTDFKNSLTKAFLTTDLKAKALAHLQFITQTKDEILSYINEFKITVHLSGIVD